ncbi:MAG: hypothetical protein HY854_21685 [Burkholderiales bacterium]|nr:hypothetical protein [Burkholderiales bacterium]
MKTDAINLVRQARSGEPTAARVPDIADEAKRDVVRAREDAVREQRNARHRLKVLPSCNAYAAAHSVACLFLASLHRLAFATYDVVLIGLT